MVLGPNRRRQAGGVLHEYVSLDGARRAVAAAAAVPDQSPTFAAAAAAGK